MELLQAAAFSQKMCVRVGLSVAAAWGGSWLWANHQIAAMT